MKHPSSRLVLNHWTDRRRHRPAPERTDIDPAAIRQALGDTFMLAADFIGDLRFRLAGTRVCALFCREIKGCSFSDLWSEDSHREVDPVLAMVSEEQTGMVAGLSGETVDGGKVDLELLLLPLAHSGEARIRALGVLAPLQPPYWLGETPVVELNLRTLRHLDNEPQRSRLLPAGARQRHGFIVYSGGLDAPRGGPAETCP